MIKRDWNCDDADYFRLFTARFLKGVRGLGQNEFKVYTLLLIRMYEEEGPLRRNDAKLATFCEMREAAFTKALDRLILIEKLDVLEDGRIFNETAGNEIDWRHSRREAGRKAGLESVARRTAAASGIRDCETDFRVSKTDHQKIERKQRSASTIVAGTLNQEEGEEEKEGCKEEKDTPYSPPKGSGVVSIASRPDIDPTEFETVWEHYPRKVGKGQAKRAWARARRKASFEEIVHPLGQFIRAIRGTDLDKVPHLSTWLNGERWLDDQSHARNAPRTSTEDLRGLAAISAADDIARLMGSHQPQQKANGK
jgi:uncharacterized protein YdaU (DUF1376 family)